jgi:hypothetical protein
MGERRSVTVALTLADDMRNPAFRSWEAIRFEFGPWWWRLWQVVRYGGRRHHTITGEPCVVFPAATPKGGA